MDWEKILLQAVEASVAGTGLNPSWVFDHIIAIVRKYSDERYDALRYLYAKHIHDHRLGGAADVCDDCFRLIDEQVDEEIQRRHETSQ